METPKMKQCERYKAKVMPEFCKKCQATAQDVFLRLVAYPENGMKISDITDTNIDRFVTCGDCPDNPVPLPVDLIEKKIRKSIGWSIRQLIRKERQKDDIKNIAHRI
jgi:hypothetical protein